MIYIYEAKIRKAKRKLKKHQKRAQKHLEKANKQLQIINELSMKQFEERKGILQRTLRGMFPWVK